MSSKADPKTDLVQTPIAIIGMGCLFPTARTLTEFWRTLRTGRDAITEVPTTHWRAADYFDPDPKKPDMTYCVRGGFLSQIPFDPTEFGIPPTILEATDTTQLLGLVAAKAALEDAGYGESRDFARDAVSVIVGVTGTQELVLPLSARLGHPIWRRALAEAGVRPEVADDVVRRISDSYVPWQENSFPGLLGNVVAGRIANRLNLRGTNCVVDAACASSLSAVHLAMLELSTGRCEMAVAGGADTLNDIFMYMCFSKTPALSPTGDARPFSLDADGTVLGEGVGMLLLKRLDDAERDGDRIYAVLRGMGTSSDGRSQSIYAPHAAGQARALREAYRLAGFGPDTIELIEAHGTGTKVGDATEFEALKSVFGESPRDTSWCALGSVKSQIGHTKAAAGVAGLMKAALAIHYRAIPPTIKVSEPNPKLGLEDSPFYLNTELRPWLAGAGRPRRAGVSAFGFGGSNFHAVLEEHDAALPVVAWDGSAQIVAMSAETLEDLRADLDDWIAFLSTETPSDSFLAHRAAQSREAFRSADEFRLVMVAGGSADAAVKLKSARDRLASNPDAREWSGVGAFFGTGPLEGQIAFVFPGQGSQYLHMGRDLACTFPEMIAAISEAEAVSGQPLGEFIYPRAVFKESDRIRHANALKQTEIAQPALGAVELGMARVLERFAVRPAMTAGHSFGELSALHAAGRIDAATLHRLSRLRGRLMRDGDADCGAMLAVRASSDELERLMDRSGIDVIIANRNSPSQCVLSGARLEIGKAAEACKTAGYHATLLAVSGAFHSRLMESALQPYRNALESTDIRVGQAVVFSNATGARYPDGAAEARRLLGDQLVRPVEFMAEIEAMYQAGARVFVEVGPRFVVTGLIHDILGDRPHITIALDAASGRSSGVLDLAGVLARLASLGVTVDLTQWERPVPEPRIPKMTVTLSGANHRNRTASQESPAPNGTASVVLPPLDPKRDVALPAPPSPIRAFRKPIDSDGPMLHSNSATRVEAVGSDVAQNAEASSNDPTSGECAASRSDMRNVDVEAHHGEKLEARNSDSPIETEPDTSGMKSNVTRESDSHGKNLVSTQQSPPRSVEGGDPSVSLAASVHLVQQGIAAMQQLHQQTAVAHQQFLESQTRAQQTLHVILEGHQRLCEIAVNGSSTEAPPPVKSTAVPEIPTIPARHSPRMATEKAPSRAPESPEKSVITPESIALKRVAPVSAPAPRRSDAIQPAASGVVPSSDRRTAEAALIAVVCEKTGYPADMIDLGMDIEADLGVDSIKRVEIIAAMEERLPSFRGIQPEYMGSIRTLTQIIEFIISDTAPIPQGSKYSIAPAIAVASETTAPSAEADQQTLTPSRELFGEALLSVVAELTGYPRDMLNLSMDMEADLGIDSIKRVEIVAGVEARLPGMATVQPEYMGSLRTLEQIVSYCVGSSASMETTSAQPTTEAAALNMALDAPTSPVVEASRPAMVSAPVTTGAFDAPCDSSRGDAPSSVARRWDALDRRVLKVVDLPPSGADALHIGRDREILVTDDGGELSRQMVARLDSAGYRARLIPIEASDAPARTSVGAVIIVAPPRATGESLWRRETEAFTKSAFALMKSAVTPLRAAATRGGALFATVSRMDGAFGLRGGRFDAAQGALAGLVKTASREWPDVTCRAIDAALSWTDASAVAAAVVRELGAHGPLEVGLDAGGRRGLSLERGTPPADRTDMLSPGDVVIVTGGARGVTAEAAWVLARRCRPTLVLLGRTHLPDAEAAWLADAVTDDDVRRAVREHEFAGRKPTPKELKAAVARHLARREIRANLARIESAGSVVRYCEVDICDPVGVNQALADVVGKFGCVRGLIHGAGVIEDRRIDSKTPEQFAAVFDTKVAGLRHVLDTIDLAELRAVVLFSSVSGRCGNPGQADYAAANEVLNKVAQRLASTSPAARVVSINWGPWDGGMVHPALRQEFRNHGLRLIPLDEGAEAVADELCFGAEGVEVVMGSDFESARAFTPAAPIAATKPRPDGMAGDFAAADEIHTRAPAAAIGSWTMAFERRLDVESHPFLLSHVIDGRPVLPAAVMMEWLAHAAVSANPGLNVQGLNDFRVFKGVVIRAQPPLLRLYCGRARRSGDLFDIDVELRSVSVDAATATEVLHARAVVVLTAMPSAAPPFSAPPGLLDRPYVRSMEAAYADVLFHGNPFRCIERVDGFSAEGMIVRVRPDAPPADWMNDPPRSDWLTDPLVIDAAFQTAILWTVENCGAPCLPATVRAYRRYRPGLASEPVSIVFEVRRSDRHRCTADVTIITRDGAVAARMDGIECTVDAALEHAFRRREAVGAVAPHQEH